MLPALLIIYAALFTFLAFKNFRLALGLFIISLPSYLIRFKIGLLPTTLLELNFVILFLVWFVKFARTDWARIRQIISQFPYFCISVFLFFLASIVGIFVNDIWYYSLGQWRAYFLEPMLVFVIVVGRTSPPPFKKEGVGGEVSVANARPHPEKGRGPLGALRPALPLLKGEMTSPRDLILFLTLSTIPISLVAIIQKLTDTLYPPSLWNDELFGRVTSFFTSPNAVGLYLGPLILLILPLLIHRLPRLNRSLTTYYLLLAILLATLALFFTKSLGAWVAVGIGFLLFLYLTVYSRATPASRDGTGRSKKTTLAALFIGIALAISLFPYFSVSKSQSLSNRLILWEYSWNYLTTSPKNFIFGAGIRQFFRKVQKPYYDAKELERLIYPHNIFLNFWTEIGLFGLIGFIGICCSLLTASYFLYKHSDKVLGAALLAALAAILIHGMIDVPYFKNDLAMIFWIIVAIIINRAQTKNLSAADSS